MTPMTREVAPPTAVRDTAADSGTGRGRLLRPALAVLVFALLVRLAALALTFPGNENVAYYDDAKIAINLVEGRGYSVNYDYRNFLLYESILSAGKLEDPVTLGTRTTALKQPAYPLLLTLLFYSFGTKNFLAVFLLHAVISSFTVVLLFLCLQRTVPAAALAAAAASAVYPPFFGHPVTVPESTTLLLFLIMAFLWCSLKIKEKPSRSWWLLAGAAGGLLVLTEPITLPFVGIGLLYSAWLDRRETRRRITSLATAGLVVCLMISPWLVRNYLVFDRFPLFKTGASGHIFVWGLKYSGNGSWLSDDRVVALEKAGRSLNEVQEEDAISREVRALFPSHWREYVTSYIPRHFVNLWWDIPSYRNDYSMRYMLGRRIPFLLLLCFAVPAMYLTLAALLRWPSAALRSRALEVLAFTLMVTMTAVYSLVGTLHSRYRLPLELAMFIFAAGTLQLLLGRVSVQRGSGS